MRLRVIVVGGSIGGLTTAVLLRDLGCDVNIFERSAAELEGRGAGIVVHPLSVRYLVENGIADIDALSVASHQHVHLDSRGAVVNQDPIGYRYTSWNTLYRNLMRNFGPEPYHFGRSVTQFETSESEVIVQTSGGEMHCDLLVFADGVASTGRTLLQPSAQPRYAGYVGWRGTVQESALSPGALDRLEDTIVYHWTGDSHILAYIIPGSGGEVRIGQRLVNFVWYRNVAEAELADLMTDGGGVEHLLSMPPGSVQVSGTAW